jgi:2-succinyl-6-hydroxy-2,4-cyclohexadiene-1-carboxylate synthase
VALHVEVRGSGPPLVLLHGFTQTARLWGRFGDLVGVDRTVVALDLPGHGGSGSVRADLPTTADLVADAVRDAIGRETPCDVLGYSLGARVALHTAIRTDLAVDHLMLIGASGGITDPVERTRRQRADEALALELESSSDVEAFVLAWLRRPMFARLTSVGASDLEERLRNTPAGLASSLRQCGAAAGEPLWGDVGHLTCPLLALAGMDDIRFARQAVRLSRVAPGGVVSLVPGGGHAVHLAQPDHTARIIGHWLDTVPAPAPLTTRRRS